MLMVTVNDNAGCSGLFLPAEARGGVNVPENLLQLQWPKSYARLHIQRHLPQTTIALRAPGAIQADGVRFPSGGDGKGRFARLFDGDDLTESTDLEYLLDVVLHGAENERPLARL